jgi:hypothetical protein
MSPKGPYRLCTVNTAPERAKRLVGRFVEEVKAGYTIIYLENVESAFPLSQPPLRTQDAASLAREGAESSHRGEFEANFYCAQRDRRCKGDVREKQSRHFGTSPLPHQQLF